MFGRIHVKNVPPRASLEIAKIFGIANVMPVSQTNSDLDSILDLLLQISTKEIVERQTFAIRPKVVDSHPYQSRDIAIRGGNLILKKLKDRHIKVNLDDPDIIFFIEVRGNETFIYTKKIPGVRGLPYGSQGKMVSLFSGGIDSPVATWLMMKRGASVLPLFMNQTPHVGESYVERVEKAFKKISEYVPTKNYPLFIADIGNIMDRILESPEPKSNCLLCKRSMYRIAETFAKTKKAKGIITGESLGQVASQTLDNLHTIDSAVHLPVYRPLIGLDKVEIEDISRKIGTYNLTAKRVEGCDVVPKNPATISKIEKIEALEKKLDLIKLCKEASQKIEKKKLN
jgi:thiamine biosynthesis protein ThiI